MWCDDAYIILISGICHARELVEENVILRFMDVYHHIWNIKIGVITTVIVHEFIMLTI